MPDFPPHCAVRTVQAGYEYRIVLRPMHAKAGLKRSGALLVYATHDKEPELVVPLYAMKQRRGNPRP